MDLDDRKKSAREAPDDAEPESDVIARLRVVAAMLKDAPDLPGGPAVLWRNREGQIECRRIVRTLIVGREPTCDICLPSRRASRQHCRIERSRDGSRLTDLDTTNGTKLNNRPLRDPAELRSGDLIEVAGWVLAYCVT